MINNENIIDFKNSFFLWETLSGSEGRFNPESVTEVNNEAFLLLSSVMACDVYGKNPLFHDPPYLFEAVFGNNDVKIFRTYKNKTANTTSKKNDLFKTLQYLINTSIHQKLETFDEIAESARTGCQLSGQARYEIDNREVLIKFPIKHINVSKKKREFQVETGKVLFYQDSLEKSVLAYLAFKNFDIINFLTQDGNRNKILSYNAEIEIHSKNSNR